METETNPQTASGLPVVIGVIGGIASGKSNFTNVMQSLGAEKIDADALAHQVLRRPLIVRRLAQLLGENILTGGEVDRGKLAAIVFSSDSSSVEALKVLEEITHPAIHAEAVRRLGQLREAGEPDAVVIDAPLLLEAGWAPMCDAIVFLDTPEHVRLARCQARGWTRAHFDSRENAQLPLEEKRMKATHMVSGELDAERLRDYCARLLQSIVASKTS